MREGQTQSKDRCLPITFVVQGCSQERLVDETPSRARRRREEKRDPSTAVLLRFREAKSSLRMTKL
jgi:hypothetical protein